MIKYIAIILIMTLGACSTPRIEEDDPRWDCRTMGNGNCGTELEI